jgi:hypothetical protein
MLVRAVARWILAADSPHEGRDGKSLLRSPDDRRQNNSVRVLGNRVRKGVTWPRMASAGSRQGSRNAATNSRSIGKKKINRTLETCAMCRSNDGSEPGLG